MAGSDSGVQSGCDALVLFIGFVILCMFSACVPRSDSHLPAPGVVHRKQANILVALGLDGADVSTLGSSTGDVPGYYAPDDLFPHLQASTVSLLANGKYRESFDSDIPVPPDAAQKSGQWDVTNGLIRLVPDTMDRNRGTQAHYYMWLRCPTTDSNAMSQDIAGDWLLPLEAKGSVLRDLIGSKDVDEARMLFIQRALRKQPSNATNPK